MKVLRYLLISVVLLTAGFFLLAKLTGNSYLIKGLWASYLHGANSATIDDARFFETNAVEAPSETWEWPLHKHYNKKPLSERLSSSLEKTKSVAFLVIKNDSILHEYYWDGYSDSSRSNSFSAAKSIVTMLTQIAVQKGIFKSWDQKVTDFLPGLKGKYAGELTLSHLSTMSSGLDWDEHYKNPFSITAKAYYGDNLWDLMVSLPIMEKPGQHFHYQSGSTQLLGMTLIKATGKSLSELASEWLWKPLQARHNAQWHLDKADGTELAYCCFNTNARDFARFGRLMLHRGNWNGQQILDTSFIPRAVEGLAPHYGHAFWVDNSYGTQVFYQRGILGQYIITIPEHRLVIVRLGHQKGKTENHHPVDFRIIVEEILSETRS